MIFIKSDEKTIHCIKSLDGLERVYLKKEEDGYSMVFEGLEIKKQLDANNDVIFRDKVVSLGNIDEEIAMHKLDLTCRGLYEKVVNGYGIVDLTE